VLSRNIMTEDIQPSNFRRVQTSRIALLLLGSILSGSLLSSDAALAELNEAPIKAQTSGVNAQIDRVAQASNLNDINGNWAEPFIRVLVGKGIIKGYPDGTFKPNQQVTRAEFAAMLNKAFDLQPIRDGKQFKDIPKKYWAKEVIDKAYRGGFLAGYADGSFSPNRNILRIESLVSLTNGSKLTAAANLNLDAIFADSAQVPSYGKDPLIAATQRCMAVGVDYDSSQLPGGNFNPNQAATRADVAALIHQVLVSTGKLTALDKTSPVNKYIASCPQGTYMAVIVDEPTPEPTPTPPPAPVEPVAPPVEAVPLPSSPTSIATTGTAYNFSAPVSGLNSPSGFGANWGDVFLGAGYQRTTRPQIFAAANAAGQGTSDGAIAFGFGLGDSRNIVGLEVVGTSNSTFRRGFFQEGAFSFKLHKQFGENFAVALGSDNLITYGTGSDVGQTTYGTASLVLNPNANLDFLSNTTVSLGLGNGRFRTVGDVRENRNTVGVFGSIGTRISPNVSLVADWDGQDLGVGVPIGFPLGDSFSIQVLPAVVDLVNRETGGRRFVFSGGIGFRF
jgi:hypothetical protein